MSVKQLFTLLLAIGLLYGCAKSGRLSGGPKDETPPKLVTEKSFNSKVVQYNQSKKIELYFDEYINLSNPTQNVLISPPVGTFPKISTRGKKLTIEWDDDEPLLEDMTYRIELEKAISDFTEGNKMEQMTLVLSTGDQIDTMTLNGAVNGGSDADRLIIALYTDANPSDSTITKSKPRYYTTVDEGRFSFQNIKEGAYDIVAFNDKNYNTRYDASTEVIGFLDEVVMVSDSSKNVSIDINTLPQEQKVVSLENKKIGRVEITFTRDDIDVDSIRVLGDSIHYFTSITDKTCSIWYTDSLQQMSVSVYGDTMTVRNKSKDSTYYNTVPKVMEYTEDIRAGEELFVTFDKPLARVDRIYVWGDSSKVVCAHCSTMIDNNILSVGNLLPQDSIIMIDTTCMVDVFGNKPDSTMLRFHQYTLDQLGVLTLGIVGMDNTIYRIEVSDGKGITYFSDAVTLDTTLAYITTEKLVPNTYKIEVLEDRDKNGRWTEADYFAMRQEERKQVEEVTFEQSDTLIINFEK